MGTLKQPIIWVALTILFTASICTADSLTFEDRVSAQEAIERVYYEHRLWPKENPQPKPSFESMVPRETLEAKVEDYLKKSAALEKYWKRPITAKQLQAEMDRMAKGTQDSATLKELFTALNNSPTLIAECLARPTLVNRLIHNWYAYDDRFHGDLEKEAEELHAELTPSNFASLGGENYQRIEFEMVEEQDNGRFPGENPAQIEISGPEFSKVIDRYPAEGEISSIEESADSFVIFCSEEKDEQHFTGGVIIIKKTPFDSWWKIASQNVAAFEPGIAAGATYTLPLLSSGTDSYINDYWAESLKLSSPSLSSRFGPTSVWTGNAMIIWGGQDSDGVLISGSRYNPATDTWQPTSTQGDCPTARTGYSAIWNGSEMIIWGGHDGDYSNTGYRYDPYQNRWRQIPDSPNCPSKRYNHTAIWTGTEMIIWGGWDGLYLKTGGRYNPDTDIWEITSTNGSCPEARRFHTAIWTGSEMIIWGGRTGIYSNSGGKYFPDSDTWLPTAIDPQCPTGRRYHTAVWTGSEMIIWGGWYDEYLNTGGRYDPLTDSWSDITTATGCPAARLFHSAVWTGTEMIIWGGNLSDAVSNQGGRYNPASDSWVPTSTDTNCPFERSLHTAIWTGTEMIIWGGTFSLDSQLNSGGRYAPETDSWIPTSLDSNYPSGRSSHTAVWTGTEMIIWGGRGGYVTNTGSRYNPYLDTWTTTSIYGSCPSPRYGHTAVWTGSEMIVWGGKQLDYQLFTGGCYDPLSDTWRYTSNGEDSPSSRKEHTALWTGSEMIIWGGLDNHDKTLNSGSKYDPLKNTWSSTLTGVDSPEPRRYHTAVWTGTDMIIWGGYNSSSMPLQTGDIYNLESNTWTPVSIGDNSPIGRYYHTAVWTGTEMIIWGGREIYYSSSLTGARYNPAYDIWSQTSTGINTPTARSNHTAIWTGSEMIIWGGRGSDNENINTGSKYNPETNTWKAAIQDNNTPPADFLYKTVWTGSEMIVWGGIMESSELYSGGIYHPSGLSNKEYVRDK